MRRINRLAIILALSAVMVLGAAFASSAADKNYFKQTKSTATSFTVSWDYTLDSEYTGTESDYIGTIIGFKIINDDQNIVYQQTFSDLNTDNSKNLKHISGSKTFSKKNAGFTSDYKMVVTYDWLSKFWIENYPDSWRDNIYTNNSTFYSDVNTLPKKITKANFGMSSVYNGTASFNANKPAAADGVQFKVYNVKTGKCIGTSSGYSYSKDIDISKNKAYRYKVRAYYDNSTNGKRYYGAWSSYRYFIDGTAKLSHSSSYNGCKLKLKGVSKVSAYKVYVTKSYSNKKGTLTKTVSPKKIGKFTTYKINKIGKNKMKKGMTYYVNVYPVIKDKYGKHVSDIYMRTNFYNSRY